MTKARTLADLLDSSGDVKSSALDNATTSLSDLSVTATASELNTLDGITASTAELNLMDGVTATTAEINYLDGVTSNIQTQINGISSDLVDDATPQLGGNLDLNGNNITGTGNIPAANLTGSLPAIDGSSLTGISSVGGATGVDFNDSVKARFGTGNDLEIYHDGSASYIHDGGTGDLNIRGANVALRSNTGTYFFYGNANTGVAALYNDGSSKLNTTNDGVNVSGHVYINEKVVHNGDTDTYLQFTNNEFNIFTGGSREVTVNATGVRLGDTGNGYFRPVSGTYGSVEIDGGAHGGWEGYSIGGRAVFMHNNGGETGLYDDVNNKWLLHSSHGGRTSLYNNGSQQLMTGTTGDYGSIQVKNGANAWSGIEMGDNQYVWMTNSSGSEFGMYDDSNNRWMLLYNTSNNSLSVEAEGSNVLRVNLTQGSSKVWARIEQFGTHSTRDSYNVSSVTDSSTANTTLTINNDMNNANYAPTGSQMNYNYPACGFGSAAAGSVNVQNTVDANYSWTDGELGFSIHGDLA